MHDDVELEIGIHDEDDQGFLVDLRFERADDEAVPAPVRGRARFDVEQLRGLSLDPVAYGKRLTQSLFADPALCAAFERALGGAGRVRLRLFLEDSARALHELRWETLRRPGDDTRWLVTDESVVFSRFVRSSDPRPVRLRRRREVTAAVVVANPSPSPAPIDVEGELGRARGALGNIRVSAFATDRAQGRHVTPSALSRCLGESPDIVYLVCHGMLKPGTQVPILLLEKEDGGMNPTPATPFVEQIRDMASKPALVVLASCQSAGNVAALGPLLAQAGVPAVLAMQGNVQMSTIERLMPTFFSELGRHGEADRALAAARNVVRGAPDAWMPALFLRLRSGRIWTPTFRPSRWVLVAGVGRRQIPERAALVARRVGRRLAEDGYGMVVGGWEGVDYVAAEAFAEVMRQRRMPLSSALKQIVPPNMEPHFKGGDVIQVGRGVQEWIECLKTVCAAILIGGADEAHGADGTYETYGYGLAEQKPVFPFGSLAGGSRRAYREMVYDYEAQPLPNIPLREFEEVLGAPLDDEEGVNRSVEGVMKMIDRCD